MTMEEQALILPLAQEMGRDAARKWWASTNGWTYANPFDWPDVTQAWQEGFEEVSRQFVAETGERIGHA